MIGCSWRVGLRLLLRLRLELLRGIITTGGAPGGGTPYCEGSTVIPAGIIVGICTGGGVCLRREDERERRP